MAYWRKGKKSMKTWTRKQTMRAKVNRMLIQDGKMIDVHKPLNMGGRPEEYK
jgi:hypothetical protein